MVIKSEMEGQQARELSYDRFKVRCAAEINLWICLRGFDYKWGDIRRDFGPCRTGSSSCLVNIIVILMSILCDEFASCERQDSDHADRK